jgi:hypothetical protein
MRAFGGVGFGYLMRKNSKAHAVLADAVDPARLQL